MLRKSFKLKNIVTHSITRSQFERTLDKDYINCQLMTFFNDLYKEKPSNSFEFMKFKLGFNLYKAPSIIKNAGFGVFANGNIKKGAITSIYCGSVYEIGEPMFFQSVGNKFILKRVDGSLIDGNDRHLSKIIFKSCVSRQGITEEDTPLADSTWLNFKKGNEVSIRNPMAIGHYINSTQRSEGEGKPNVMYLEFDFENWPLNLHYLIPNVHYSLNSEDRVIKSTVLIALEDIDHGEELFASYYNLVQNDKG